VKKHTVESTAKTFFPPRTQRKFKDALKILLFPGDLRALRGEKTFLQ
jgi:hypothetical protein